MATSESPLVSADDIEFGKYIGIGAYGHIYNGQHKKWGPVSIRCLDKHIQQHVQLPPVSSQSVLQEAQDLSTPHHKNILQLMGIIATTQTVKCIIYEPVAYGSLKSFLTLPKNMNISSHVKVQFMHDVVLGMSYLHSVSPKIIHGDLNWNRVQVGEFFQLKISDFGLKEWKNCVQLLRDGVCLGELATHEQTGVKQEDVSDMFSYATLSWSIVHQTDPPTTSRSAWPLAVLECCPQLHLWLQEWWHPNLNSSVNFTNIKNQLDPFVRQHAAKIEHAKIQLLTANRLYPSDSTFETDSADFSQEYPYYTASLEQQQQQQEKSVPVRDTGAVNSDTGYNTHIGKQNNGHIEKSIGDMKIHMNHNDSNGVPTLQGSVHTSNGEGHNIHISGVPYIQIGKGNVLNVDSKGIVTTTPKSRTSGKSSKPVKKITVTCSKKKLDPQNMDTLAKSVGLDWKRLARMLKFDDGEIDTIDHDNHGLYEKIYQMLRQWVEKIDKEATLCAVADALIAMKKAEVAAKIDDTL